MRYKVQRVHSWEWLDLDFLPASSNGPSWVRTSYGDMEFTVSPDVGKSRAFDGRLLFEEWGTLVYVESEDSVDQVKWAGIVSDSDMRDGVWTVKLVELPGYADGIPIEELIRGIKEDPVVLIRRVWDSIQSWSSSWLNISVSGSSPIRVGTDLDDKLAAARAEMDGYKTTLDTFSKDVKSSTKDLSDNATTLADEVDLARKSVSEAQATVTQLIRSGAPDEQINDARALVVTRQNSLNALVVAYNVEIAAGKAALANAKSDQDAARADYDKSRERYQALQERRREEHGAFEIRPEENTDAHRALLEIANANGIEWRTRVQYSDTHPDFYIECGYPQIGNPDPVIRIEQGVNLISTLELNRNGGSYANTGLGIGAGEGKSMISATVANSSNRLRRPVVVEDKSIKNRDVLATKVRNALSARSGEPYVSSVEVKDHPSAPLFSFWVGDTVWVSGLVPHHGEYLQKHRIKSIRWTPENTFKIQLDPVFNVVN